MFLSKEYLYFILSKKIPCILPKIPEEYLPSLIINFLNCFIKSFLNNSSVSLGSFLNFDFFLETDYKAR